MALLSNINNLFSVDSTGAIKFNNLTGTNNQVLIANTGTSPTWVDVDTIIGGPYLPLTGGTLAGAGNLVIGGTLTVNGVTEFNEQVTVKQASNVSPGKIIVEGLAAPIFQLKNNDAQTSSDQLLSSMEFYGSDTSSSNVAGVRASIKCSTGFDDPTGTSNRNQGCLEFATYNGTDVSNTPRQHLKITPDGGFSFGLTSTAYGTSGQVLTSNGDAPPSWQDNAGGDISGSGTTNAVAKFTGTKAIGDGPITFATNDSTFAGSITATSASIPTMAGNPNFTGDIYQYGSVFRTSSFINLLNNINTKKYLQTASFANGVSNQAVNIQFPNVAMQGYYKITLSGSYSNQDISGKLTKVIPFGYNPNGSIWRTGNTQSEITIATGGVSTNFTIGNLAWDSTNSKFIVPIYKLTSTGNSVRILIEYFGGAANNLKDVSLSSNYTQTAPSPFNVRQYQNIRDRLGIGTSSPTHKLQVLSTDNKSFLLDRNTGNNAATLNEFSEYYSLSIKNRNSGSYLNFAGNGNATTIQATDGAASATAKSISLNPFGGNVGIGIGTSLPSYPLDVTGAIRSSSGVYLNNASGGFLWNQANAHIAFGTNNTERMRITAGGDITVSGSSSGSVLNLNGGVAPNGVAQIIATSSGVGGETKNLSITNSSFAFNHGSGSFTTFIGNASYEIQALGAIIGYNMYARGSTVGISSGGSFVFGASTTEGVYIQRPANTTDMYFIVGGNTRMVIENNGEVGINNTSPSATLHLTATASNGVPFKLEGHPSTTVEQMLMYTSKAAATNWYWMVAQANSANTIIIYGNGNINNANNSYGQLSDIRLKENVIDATSKLEDVKKLKVKNFNFKGDNLKQIGLIAQEVEEVFPGLVEEEKQPDIQDGEKGEVYKSVKYSVLVPILVKAIQELEARVKELENK